MTPDTLLDYALRGPGPNGTGRGTGVTIVAKTDVRMTPATLAALMTDPTDAPHGLGLARKWTVSDGAKRVRSIARDTIDRFVNRTGRTMHLYDLSEATAIVTEAKRATGGGIGQSADDVRAALAPAPKRAPRSRKTARKVAPAPDAAPDAGGES